MSTPTKTKIRSDAEILARTRVLIASVAIYLVCVAFIALGDHFYGGTRYAVHARLATLPLFFLLLRLWIRLVRVHPPPLLLQARRLMASGHPQKARDRFAEAAQLGQEAARLNRARQLLQDGLAVRVSDEALLETGRCSLLLGETDRAIKELTQAAQGLPLRADVALDLAEALLRVDNSKGAAEVLQRALPLMDAHDRQTLRNQPKLLDLLQGAPLPSHSAFHPRIVRERLLLLVMTAGAVIHGLHHYLGLF